jgi:hypothetical protein
VFDMNHTDRLRLALDVYEMRHFEGMKWEDVCRINGISKRQGFVLRNEAVKALSCFYGRSETSATT